MTTLRIPYADLHALITRAFLAHGVTEPGAGILATAVAGAERDGSAGHGLFRMPGYIASLKSGYVDGAAVPSMARERPGTISVDGCRGFAQVALAMARPSLLQAVRDQGIACLAIRNAHHYAGLATDIEDFAAEGFFAISMLNGRSRVAPWGAAKAVTGTNPIAFACPRDDAAPLLCDMATSAIANAEVLMAERDGHPIPPGVALDQSGAATTDPRAVLDGGALLPFGGHKGGAISVMVEVFAAALTGGRFGFEDAAERPPGAMTSNAGQVVILIDPGATGGHGASGRVSLFIQHLLGAGTARLPGDRRLAARSNAQEHGVPVMRSQMDLLESLARGAAG